MRIKQFFDSDFKNFSNLDNVRSIPSLVDGFKDAQRKAVYGMLQHGQSEIKVAQAAGQFSLKTHYAHGEVSMADTIVGLAQDFPGSNNVNLFEPIGQFGSILSSESSSHRYIYTKPSSYLRQYIRQEDDCILDHRYEDGDRVEPRHFYPLLPMWIVNGALGIGTGHSVKILPRDPKLVCDMVHKLAQGVDVQQKTVDRLLKPVFNGWTGTVESVGDNQWELYGVLEKVNTTTIRITELPVTYGVDKFKSILVDLMDKGKVKDFDNNSSELGFDFTISVPRQVGKKSEKELIKLFKLVARITENVTLWNPDGKIERYDDVRSALAEFVAHRVARYETRRQQEIDNLIDEGWFLTSKAAFIQVWNELPNPGKMTVDQIHQTMTEKADVITDEHFDRLIQLRITSLTKDQISELHRQIDVINARVSWLREAKPTNMYDDDLKQLK